MELQNMAIKIMVIKHVDIWLQQLGVVRERSTVCSECVQSRFRDDSVDTDDIGLIMMMMIWY